MTNIVKHCAPLAQLVEQGTFNPKVAGSIPSRRTTFEFVKRSASAGRFLFHNVDGRHKANIR